MNNIQEYQKALEAFERPHREALEGELRMLLSTLEIGETIPLDSNNCDGTGIAVLNYSDAINIVGRNGDTIIYNNFECDGSNGCIAHDDEDTDVFGMPLEVTVEILKCVRKYVENKLQLRVTALDIKTRINFLKHEIKGLVVDLNESLSAQAMRDIDEVIVRKKEIIKELETLIK